MYIIPRILLLIQNPLALVTVSGTGMSKAPSLNVTAGLVDFRGLFVLVPRVMWPHDVRVRKWRGDIDACNTGELGHMSLCAANRLIRNCRNILHAQERPTSRKWTFWIGLVCENERFGWLNLWKYTFLDWLNLWKWTFWIALICKNECFRLA